MRILLIEDDKEAAAYLSKALREAGHVPDHAPDGDTGAAMAAEGGYDVLVVDRMLPKRDGLSIIEELRTKDDHTPALILSALGPASAPVATTTCRSPTHFPNCLPGSRRWRAAVAPMRPRRFSASAIWSLTALATTSPERGRTYRCSRASSACSNT
jgi:hypothetical protein